MKWTFGLLLGLVPTLVTAQDIWPQFRGADGGVGEGKNLPSKWSASQNVAWSVETPGRGWSSPIVVKGKVFLTTVDREGSFDLPRRMIWPNT